MTVIAQIDTDALLQVVWGSLAATVILSVAFSVLLLGLVRSAEARREGRMVQTAAFALIAFGGLAAFSAAIAYGFAIIIDK